MRTLAVTVIGGYLGAGKTTLVNHMLRHAAGRRLAVLVNDFGELPIDAELIEGRDGDVLSLAGGCVCCGYGSDLIGVLMELPTRAPGIDHVLLETSGVALPGAVASALGLLAGYTLDAVVVMADAETMRARAADPYMGDTITRQLAAADLVVLNKADLVDAESLDETQRFIVSMSPSARLLSTSRADVPIEIIIGGERAATRPGLSTPGQIDAATLYDSFGLRVDEAIDVACLGRSLVEPSLGLIRAKGLLRDRDGRLRALHVVGARWQIDDAPDGARDGLLVLIGLRGTLNRDGIDHALRRASS